MSESLTMKEIHKIRLKNYEKTRNMTKEEKIKYINDKGEQAKRRIDKLKKSKNLTTQTSGEPNSTGFFFIDK